MSTKYANATEQMVLEEFRMKIDQEESVAHFVKSESPDGIIWTNAGKTIGIEVIRTDDSATNPKDKNKVAIFLNKFGLYDPEGVPSASLCESFTSDSYMQDILSKINARGQTCKGSDLESCNLFRR